MTGLIHIELAQVVARRITQPQCFFVGSNLTGCSFFIQFFFYFRGEGGVGSDFIILFMSYFFSFALFLHYFFFIFYPFNMYQAHI